jgi:signal peptidase I
MAKSLEQIRAEAKRDAKKNGKASGKTTAQERISLEKKQVGGKSDAPNNDAPQSLGEIALSWTRTIIGAFVMVMILNGVLVASFVVPTGSMESTVMTGDFLFVNKFIFGPSTPQMIPILNIPIPYYRFPGLRKPVKGDVIVFIFPGNREEAKPQEFQYYLKRCVATAGDTLTIRNKQIFINGIASAFPSEGRLSNFIESSDSDDRFRTFPVGAGFTRDNYGPLRIPKQGDVIELTPTNLVQWEIFIRREGHEVTTNDGKILIDNKEASRYTVERDYCFGMGDNRDNSLDSRYWGFVPMDDVVGTPLIVYWSWETNLPNLFEKFGTLRPSRLGKVIH